MEYLQEEWRPVPNYEDLYEISELGRFRRKPLPGKKYQILKPQLHYKKHYLEVEFHRNGEKIRKALHRLVAEVFLSPIPGKPLVNHRDGNKFNNQAVNLEYVDAKENAIHAVFMGLRSRTGAVTREDVFAIRQSTKEYLENIYLQYPHLTKPVVKSIVLGKTYPDHIYI